MTQLNAKTLVACAAALAILGSGAAFAQNRPSLAPPAGTPMATTHLNPNTATAAQLRAAPGSNAALADAIVKARPFKSQADLLKVVNGKVPEAELPAFYAAVFVPLDLNSATPEEIMTVPGMSRRMVHEFQEYRPYKDIAQFDREIGKYVDAGEVARLRSYVTLKQ
ncbi:MAG TPA: helix-hairpin-helix domain-containing protein [Caulobacteraceae bacterium]|jgi:DNA uptake protein ComE-like DNA-binding protein|nr:helix-hairpin-helix domain-containing protein [Caulobacteraceae bacterium]